MSQTQPTPDAPVDRAAVARLKQRAALVSVLASVVLTLGKAVAAVLSGSLALLSEALHGLIDIGATLATWFAVRAADKPADDEHHYGHGKVESLAALAETALLFALAGAVAWEACSRLWMGSSHDVSVTPLVIGVLLFSIMIDATRWRALSVVAKETGSEALAADALHFSSDLVSTSLALIGLIAVKLGYPQGDLLAAIGVSLFIVIAGFRLARRTVDTLLDTAPAGLSDRLREAATAVPGVVAIDWLRLRPSGGRVHGELGVRVSRTLPLERVVAIKERLARAITEVAPDAEITLTANPIQVDDETVLERVMLIALKLRIPVHHVTAHQVGERLCIGLDMEVDALMPLGRAHDLATRLEAAIRDEFGAETEVETHIEPMEISALDGQDAPPETIEAIAAALADEAARDGMVREVHNVRVRETPNGLVVNYHCRMDADLDVSTMHDAVDRVERAIRLSRRDVCRVVGHAEPLPAS
ncbi:MAG: cation diffusion facilitator family transporter [Bosea sp. (in: a-proteobacteria)]